MAEYATVPVVAGVAVQQNGKYLLVQEGQGKSRGKWNWPAGRVEVGNSIEETAVIEANEEAGVTVVISERVGIWHTDLAYPVSHLFHATIIGGTAHTPEGDEILAVDWFTREQIEEMESQNKLRAPWVIEATKLLAGKVID